MEIEPARPVNSPERLVSILPKVSDGAFKLYVFLFFQADPLRGRVAANDDDLTSQLGKSSEEIHGYLRELERAAAVTVLRSGGELTIDLNAAACTATRS